uniref:NACHT N-terminal helical domain 7-containing protein n=1 Tax=Lentzea alba TaxID=2714351 RepID=UPI0039BF9179
MTPTTIKGALEVLGREQHGLDRADVQLSAGQSLVTWIGADDTLPRLVQQALDRVPDRLSRTSGSARTELVTATHTAVVATAFFDLVREVFEELPDLLDELESTRSVELDAFVVSLYAGVVPAPSIARGFERVADAVGKWATERLERFHSVLFWQDETAGLLHSGLPQAVVSRYRTGFVDMVPQIPEFEIWGRHLDHSVNVDTLDVLLEPLAVAGTRQPEDELETALSVLNQAELDRPVFDVPDGEPAAPRVRDAYVAPHVRIITADVGMRLADDWWWSWDAGGPQDLDLAFARHFSGSGCTELPLLVLGAPGCGKSLLTHVLAARLPADAFTVVRVALRSVDADVPVADQIEQGLAHLTGRQLMHPEFSRTDAGRLPVVLLDGLDDLLQVSSAGTNYLLELSEYQRVQSALGAPVAVVITSRASAIDRVRIPNDIPVVRLEEFDDEQIQRWIRSWNSTNAETGRRPMTLAAALAQRDLARQPLGLVMLTLSLTDPAAARPSSTTSTAGLIKQLVDRQVRREVEKTADAPVVVKAAIADLMFKLGVLALGMFNRGRHWIAEDEYAKDMVAFGIPESATSLPSLFLTSASLVVRENHVVTRYEWQQAIFGDYLIAQHLERLLLDTARGPLVREGTAPEDGMLYVLLSHQPLAVRPSVLEFVGELAAGIDLDLRESVVRTLDALIRRHRIRTVDPWYANYHPTLPDTVSALATYSANLVLLRLHVEPTGTDWPAEELISLWKAGLTEEGHRALLSLVSLNSGVIALRRESSVAANPEDVPAGVEFVHRGLATGSTISQVTWSSDGRMLTANAAGQVFFWSTPLNSAPEPIGLHEDGTDIAWHPSETVAAVVQRLRSPSKESEPFNTHQVTLIGFGSSQPRRLCGTYKSTRISWSPDGQKLVLLGGSAFRVVDAANGTQLARRSLGPPRGGYRMRPVWLADGARLLVTDGTRVRVLRAERLDTEWKVAVVREALDAFERPDGGLLLAQLSADGNGISVDEPAADRSLAVLEGHTKTVLCARFSPNGDYLVSASEDNTVRIWRCRDWQCVSVIPRESYTRRGGIAFHPTEPLLALKDGGNVDILRLDYDLLNDVGAQLSARQYTNAKVVLVGDSGVGKSGLGLVLSGKPFAATASTHGRNVWTWERAHVTNPDGSTLTRETLLWDLAGQPGYRMVHQLHLKEVAVALIVFDARSETDPFSGVRYWWRALAQAQKLDGKSAVQTRVYLVAARADRGGTAVSERRLRALVDELGLDGHVETSAKESWGLEQLTRMIRDGIDWGAVQLVSSSALLESIKEFLVEEKEQGRVLATVDDLMRSYHRTRGEADEATFTSCLGRLESRGVLRCMEFGGYVLLQPELLDAYASSLVQAAKEEPDGLGFVPEQDALEGRFRIPEDEKLAHAQLERILLIAVVEELLRREIALKEVTDREVDLIFPAQFTRERPDAPELPGQDVVIAFDGDLHTIYSTLAVRLTHSRLFQKEAMWHNSASYRAVDGGTCGIAIREVEEGRNELTLFYDERAVAIVRRQFEVYVVEHLTQRAVAGTVLVRRVRKCRVCGFVLPENLVQGKLDRNAIEMPCPLCDEFVISLVDAVPEDVGQAIDEMNTHANAQRDRDVLSTKLKGKRESGEYDVFLCHNNLDKPAVIDIADRLEACGLLPWLDQRDIRPGERWQPAIARGVEQSKAAAVLFGPAGQGRWHGMELELIQDKALSSGKPVIPVVLGGTEGEPTFPEFLGLRHLVDMRTPDPDPIEQLIWGITGERGD